MAEASRLLVVDDHPEMAAAHGALDMAVHAPSLGAYHYLTKPFRLDTLFRLIEEALGRS